MENHSYAATTLTNLGNWNLIRWKHQFEFEAKMNVDISFTVLSDNKNYDGYTDPSLVHFSYCDMNEALQ